MISFSYFLRTDGRHLPKIYVLLLDGSHGRKKVSLNIEADAANWDTLNKRLHPTNRMARNINALLDSLEIQFKERLLELRRLNGVVSLSEAETAVRELLGIERRQSKNTTPVDLVAPVFEVVMTTAKEQRKATFATVRKWLTKYCNYDNLRFSELDTKWLIAFRDYLLKNVNPNSATTYMRTLSTVVNRAIDEEITTVYGFRRLKPVKSPVRKRALSPEDLRRLLALPLTGSLEEARDYFFISFAMMGANTADILALTPNDVESGRINFARHKTGWLYSVKIEPELAALIERYRGNKLLFNFAERRPKKSSFLAVVNKSLYKITDIMGLPRLLSSYWARHSWASVAANLDIPKETIARALGHKSSSMTDVYIDFDFRKIDAANRRVLDFIFNYNAEANTPAPADTPTDFGGFGYNVSYL